MHTEAKLLQAMAEATSLAEQKRIGHKLNKFRAKQAARKQMESETYIADSIIRDVYTPAPVHTRHTAATDWLGEIPTGPTDFDHKMRTEATMWFRKLSAEVKADRDEFAAQAEGMAWREAGAYGENAPAAARVFLDTAARLRRKGTGMVDIEQSGNSESTVTDYDTEADQDPFLAEDWSGEDDTGSEIGSGVHPATSRRKRALAEADTCIHCGRYIIPGEGEEAGYWIDPEAPAGADALEFGDGMWRVTCDSNDDFNAIHEPSGGKESSRKTAEDEGEDEESEETEESDSEDEGSDEEESESKESRRKTAAMDMVVCTGDHEYSVFYSVQDHNDSFGSGGGCELYEAELVFNLEGWRGHYLSRDFAIEALSSNLVPGMTFENIDPDDALDRYEDSWDEDLTSDSPGWTVGEEVMEIAGTIENKLWEAGYVVEWNDGVVVMRTGNQITALRKRAEDEEDDSEEESDENPFAESDDEGSEEETDSEESEDTDDEEESGEEEAKEARRRRARLRKRAEDEESEESDDSEEDEAEESSDSDESEDTEEESEEDTEEDDSKEARRNLDSLKRKAFRARVQRNLQKGSKVAYNSYGPKMNMLIETAKADFREWMSDNPDESEPHDAIFEIADSTTPVYNAEILETVSETPSLWSREPEIIAFDGTPTPVNIGAGVIFEVIEEELWEMWRDSGRDY